MHHVRVVPFYDKFKQNDKKMQEPSNLVGCMKDLLSAFPLQGNAGMKGALWAPCIHLWETSFDHGLHQVGKWEIYLDYYF